MTSTYATVPGQRQHTPNIADRQYHSRHGTIGPNDAAHDDTNTAHTVEEADGREPNTNDRRSTAERSTTTTTETD